MMQECMAASLPAMAVSFYRRIVRMAS